MDDKAGTATPAKELENQLMNPSDPKTEREWWAVREIERLREIEAKAVDDLCKWRAAFQSCTPGGSEFTSPEAVVDYMQNLKREFVEVKKENARLKIAAK